MEFSGSNFQSTSSWILILCDRNVVEELAGHGNGVTGDLLESTKTWSYITFLKETCKPQRPRFGSSTLVTPLSAAKLAALV